MFNNLHELISTMSDEKSCRAYLEKERWNGKPVCPHCNCERVYSIENGKRYKCGNKECYMRFTITVGTIFEASNIKLNKWFMAIYLCTAHKKGISSYQLSRDIGVTQKTAWFMLHRIRQLMGQHKEQLTTYVEIDETYMGGSITNKHISVRKEYAENKLNYYGNKIPVIGMVERQGNVIMTVVNNATKESVKPIIEKYVEPYTKVMTDNSGIYKDLNKGDYFHYKINHEKNEFKRGFIHTNTIEGFFSYMKRSIYGIYHQVSPKHLQQYCNENAYRYNTRKIKDAERFNLSLKNICNRLPYKTLVQAQ